MKKYNKNQDGSLKHIGCLIVIVGTIIVWGSIYYLFTSL
jgi:uncharacterized protein YjeT (DUF2065 family)